MDINQKLMEIFEDEGFKKEAETLESGHEFQELLAKYGLELDREETESLLVQIGQQVNQNYGELSEDELEQVSGGSVLFVVGCVALGVACVGGFAGGFISGLRGW